MQALHAEVRKEYAGCNTGDGDGETDTEGVLLGVCVTVAVPVDDTPIVLDKDLDGVFDGETEIERVALSDDVAVRDMVFVVERVGE